MKVVKPQTLSLLHRVVDDARQPRLVIVVLGFFAFGRERLLPEAWLWKFAANELEQGATLDECLPKTRSEVLVAGRCFAHGSTPTRASYVRVKLGAIDKRLSVLGDRRWVDGVPTDPEPFAEMPVTWARAFGGRGYAPNPLGKGHPPTPHMRSAFPLPNVELWGKLVRGPAETPAPAGLLPIDPGWPQRLAKAGTYDAAWQRDRFPGFAADVDPAYFNAAPDDQQIEGCFRSGEAFRVENMHRHRPMLEGRLPELAARALIEQRRRGGGDPELQDVPLRLDTVWLFPHAERGIVAFRGVLPVAEDDAADVVTILVAAEAPSARRTREEYRAELERRRDPDKGFLHGLTDKGLVPEWPAASGPPLPEERNEMQELLATERLQEKHGQDGAERQRVDAMAQARALLVAEGLDPDAHLPRLEPPGPLPDPTDVEAVLARIEKEEQQAEARAAELEAMRVQMESDARRACEEAGADYDAVVAHAKQDAARPPKPHADEELTRLRGVLAEAREHGAEAQELEEKLSSGELEAMLREADRANLEMYRMGADTMDAPPATQGEEAIRQRELVRTRIAAGESLEGADLTGVDLSGIDVQGGRFDGALLAGAHMPDVHAAGSTWFGAVLAHADLGGADLREARLNGANLGGAKLARARLGKADLTGAVLRHADLSETDLSASMLRDADLSGANLAGASFRDAQLPEQTFLKANLQGASFAGAVLAKSNFIEADLSGVDFTGAELELVTFVGCRLDGANFAKARGAKMHAVNSCSFAKVDFRGAVLTGAFLRGSNLRDAVLEGADLRSADLSECTLTGARLRRANARDAMLVRSDLTGADLMGTDLLGAILSKAKLQGADLRLANLFRADLSRVELDEDTNILGANVKQARIWPKRANHGPL
jgi:uncharacterized protein YjbI with pentapeptide repeats